MTVYITDYIQDPDIEKKILGPKKISKNKETAEVKIFVWRVTKVCSSQFIFYVESITLVGQKVETVVS